MKRKIILVVVAIAIALMAVGCIDSKNTQEVQEIQEVKEIQKVKEVYIEPNLEIVSVNTIDSNIILKIRNNNDVAVDNIYAGVIGMISPMSEPRIPNNINTIVSNVLVNGVDSYPCVYDEQYDVCIDTVPESYLDVEYVVQYYGGSRLAYRYYDETIKYEMASKAYIGTINPHEVVDIKFGLNGLAGHGYKIFIKVVYTEDKSYWSVY